ncbi:hypothetical protein ACIPJN_30100 [Streptomyces sp. NPDC086796]|uniref:hypothetical protein n=1 Tax=Streptomyces sp. NPDC086796 TaxID=3365760 RepID=UPI003805EA3E
MPTNITRPVGEPPATYHETAIDVPAHQLAAHGGTAGALSAARGRLADRPCHPDPRAITVTTETAADGSLHITAQVECTDTGCAFSAEVRVQRELLTALLEGTSEFVKETAAKALALGKGPAHRPAAWADHQETIGRALRGLIDTLEPYAAERTEPPADDRPAELAPVRVVRVATEQL